MHKNILKFFNFLRIIIDFYKIVITLEMLFYLFYWVEHLLGTSWKWLNFSRPISQLFVHLGSLFSNHSIQLLNALFEYKFGIGFMIIVASFFVMNFFKKIVNKLEEIYSDSRFVFKKFQENQLNKSLEKAQINEQKKINNYKIYVETKIKKKFNTKDFNINLEEQNIIMNKFLIKNTGVSPQKYGNGFVYTFNNFNNIDEILDVFFKVINAKTPLDYVICLEIINKIDEHEVENFEKLISMQITNKIVTLADTVWKYGYNEKQGYQISVIGSFQVGERTIEISEFVNKFGL